MKKRLLPLLLTMVMLCSIVFMLPSCTLFERENNNGNESITDQDDEQDKEPDKNQGNNDNVPAEPTVTIMKAANKYIAEPVENVLYDMTSYRDNEYFYYIFHLGELNGVPLQDNVDSFKYDGNDYTYSFKKSYSSSQSISTSVKRAVENSTSWTRNFNISGSLSIKNIANIDLGYSKQWGESTITSAEKSYDETSNFSESYESSFQISFNENYPTGYYRWILFGDIDVYAAIEYEIATGEYSFENYSVVASNYFTLDYCKDSSRFDDVEYGELPFQLTVSDIQRLPEPTEWISEEGLSGMGTKTNPFLINSAEDFKTISLKPSSYYKINANINFGGEILSPIPLFSGTIDGNNKTLSNFIVREDNFSNTTGSGLFKENHGEVVDLTIEDCSITASPNFGNQNITVYAGAIAAINYGSINHCKILNTTVISNSSDTAERFEETYFEDPREIAQGQTYWKAWIQQSHYSKTSAWASKLEFNVCSGGITGLNCGIISNSRFTGKVEANLYNMGVPQSTQYNQTCYAGGIAGYNNVDGTISLCSSSGTVNTWLEMSNDAGGMGWVDWISPKGQSYACGIAGYNNNGSIIESTSTCSLEAKGRVYAAVYWLFSGAGYNKGTRASNKNMALAEFAIYGHNGN